MGCGPSSQSEGGVFEGTVGGHLRVPMPGSWRTPGIGLTLADLQARREQFWDTVHGHPVMWANLKLVCQALLAGDVELAGTILDSTGMRPQRANLVDQAALCVYDATGVLYEMPRLVWSTPANLLSVEEAAAALAASSGGGSGGGRRRQAAPSMPIAIKVRLAPSASSCEQDIPLDASTGTNVEQLRVLLHEALLSGRFDMADVTIKRPNVWSKKGGLPPARQRLMYRGKELKDGILTLGDVGIQDGDILQIYIKGE